MSELKAREETLLQKSDSAAKALRSKALQDAMVLLRQATKTAESGATDVAAKALLRQAVEDARVLVSEAAETAKELLTIAAETAETLLARVKQLEGIIPICMYCKKIRDDEKIWQQLEIYISDHSDAQFSHGICEKCMAEKFGEKMAERVSKKLTTKTDISHEID